MKEFIISVLVTFILYILCELSLPAYYNTFSIDPYGLVMWFAVFYAVRGTISKLHGVYKKIGDAA